MRVEDNCLLTIREDITGHLLTQMGNICPVNQTGIPTFRFTNDAKLVLTDKEQNAFEYDAYTPFSMDVVNAHKRNTVV